MKLRTAFRRAGLDTTAAALRLIVICTAVGIGYDLADRLLTRLTVATALIVVGVVLAIGAGWIATVRTGNDLARLQHRHEDDEHSIQELKRTNLRLERDLRRQRDMSDHLVQEIHRLGGDVSLPLPRPARLGQTRTEVLDEQPTGGER